MVDKMLCVRVSTRRDREKEKEREREREMYNNFKSDCARAIYN